MKVRVWLRHVLVFLGLLLAIPTSVSQTTQLTGSVEEALYSENFEDGKAQDWELEGNWKVIQDRDGNFVLRGQGHEWARYLGDSWGDYTFKLRLKLVRGRIHLNFRNADCLRYFIGVQEERIDLNKTQPCGTHRELRARERFFSPGRWYEIKIVGKGNKIEIFVDGWSVLSFTDPSPILYGTIALETLEDSEFYVDDIVVFGQRPPTYGLRWVKTGGPLGGLGYDIKMRPDNPDILYVTDTWSGVNISTDGGRTWFASNEGITTRTGPSGDAIPVFCLTIDPHNPDVIWVGTQNSRGIFKSTDGGKTWVEKTTGIVEKEGISFRGITVHPKDPNIVFVAAEISSFAWTPDHTERTGKEFDLTKGVVYKTTNGGESWTAIWRGDNLARYILINPQNPDIIYVSTGIFDREAANTDFKGNKPGGVGILKSIDGGRTWRVLGETNGLKNLYIGSLFMHPQNPDILLAAAGNNAWSEGSGVYLSTNGGETWHHVLKTNFAMTSVEFSTTSPNIAYAGSEVAIYRSEDGGWTWSRCAMGPMWGPPGVRAGFPIDFQLDPRNAYRIFVNNYGGGNFLSEDGGHNWVVASQGYTGAQLRDIALSGENPQHVFVVGRSGPYRSFDGGASWEGLTYDDAAYLAEWYAIALHPNNPNIVLLGDEHEGQILRSADGGLHWRVVFKHSEVFPGDFRRRHGFKDIVFAPSNPQVVYAGMRRESRNIDEGRADPSFGIYKSTDAGLTWKECNDARTSTQNINALAVDPRNENIVYAATVKSGIFKTLDGGKIWQPVNQGLQVLDIRSLAIDPNNPQVIYAGAENGGIYKSTNGGAHWEHIGVGMDPMASVRAIAIDPTNPEVVYAADLRTGVYRSADGGKIWVKLNEGLRTRAVTALAISADGTVLYAATEGEGVFRLDLSGIKGR